MYTQTHISLVAFALSLVIIQSRSDYNNSIAIRKETNYLSDRTV